MFVAGSMRTADLTALHRNIHYRASSCVLVTICVICVCVMVVCGVVIAREYALSSEYEAATCRLHRINYTAEPMDCNYCGGEKKKGSEKGSTACTVTHYPCLQVLVTYQQPLNNASREALLNADSIQANNGIHSKCSFYICLRTLEENRDEVEQYATQWRHGGDRLFPCFYNTYEPDRVIPIKKYSKYDVLHGMLWPSVIIAICGIVFLRLETVRRGYTCCGVVESQTSCGTNAAVGNNTKAISAGGTGVGGKKNVIVVEVTPNDNGFSQPNSKLLTAETEQLLKVDKDEANYQNGLRPSPKQSRQPSPIQSRQPSPSPSAKKSNQFSGDLSSDNFNSPRPASFCSGKELLQTDAKAEKSSSCHREFNVAEQKNGRRTTGDDNDAFIEKPV